MRIFSCTAILIVMSLANQTCWAAPMQQDDVESKYDDWLESDGQNPLFKIRIDVFLPSGQPADAIKAQFMEGDHNVDQKYRVDGNRITAWMSPSRRGTFAELWITTTDDRFSKRLELFGHEIRQLGIGGLKVDLVPLRQIRVHVIDPDSNPVQGAEIIGESATTNRNGDAFYKIPADHTQSRISVIAPNGQVGVLNMFANPNEAQASEFEIRTVPLEKCAKQTIRLIDEKGNPVKHISLSPSSMDRNIIVVPDKGYPVRADENGEAKLTWLPGLPGSRAYISVSDPEWTVVDSERTPALWTIKLQRLKCKTITGKLNVPDGVQGGFEVELCSFDRPGPSRIHGVTVRSDDQGNFVADVLPGAHYCVYITDPRWVGSIWDGVLAEEDTDKLVIPELTVERGLPVKIIATQGEARSPMANARIWVTQKHHYQKKTGSALDGPAWFVTTDDKGVAYAYAAPQALEATINVPTFSDKASLAVEQNAKNEIRFHRETVKAISIQGQLHSDTAETIVGGATVLLHTTDGNTTFSSSGVSSDNGSFQLQGLGERFSIFAMTADKEASGFTFVEKGESRRVKVELTPTSSFRGRLLDPAGEPLQDCKLKMVVRLTDPADAFFGRSREVASLRGTTDANGHFEFKHVPTSIPVMVWIDDVRVSDSNTKHIGEFMFFPTENRPLETYQVGQYHRLEKESLESRIANLKLNCKINSVNFLLTLIGDGPKVENFYRQAFDTLENNDLYWYLPAVIDNTTVSEETDSKPFMAKQQWEFPKENQIALVATDPSGVELDRITLDVSDEAAKQRLKEFLSRNKGETQDAKAKFDAALAEAKDSNRKVWAQIGHTRCAPCFQLGQWVNSQKQTLEKEYVFLKIDIGRDLNAHEVSELVTSGSYQGVPFYAILDVDGSILIDSEGPLGNIGFPGHSFEGKRHLEQMLKETSNTLSPKDIQGLIQAIKPTR